VCIKYLKAISFHNNNLKDGPSLIVVDAIIASKNITNKLIIEILRRIELMKNKKIQTENIIQFEDEIISNFDDVNIFCMKN
jgi:hypothetical protein